MHGGLCRGMLGLNRPSSRVSQLHSQPLFAVLPSRRWLSSPELLDDVCERTARFCQNFRHVRNPAVQVHLRGKAGGGVKSPMGKTSWTHSIAIPTAVAGRGGAYGGAAVLTCADARSPSLPRC